MVQVAVYTRKGRRQWWRLTAQCDSSAQAAALADELRTPRVGAITYESYSTPSVGPYAFPDKMPPNWVRDDG